jgi:hypothetical protein
LLASFCRSALIAASSPEITTILDAVARKRPGRHMVNSLLTILAEGPLALEQRAVSYSEFLATTRREVTAG